MKRGNITGEIETFWKERISVHVWRHHVYIIIEKKHRFYLDKKFQMKEKCVKEVIGPLEQFLNLLTFWGG